MQISIVFNFKLVTTQIVITKLSYSKVFVNSINIIMIFLLLLGLVNIGENDIAYEATLVRHLWAI